MEEAELPQGQLHRTEAAQAPEVQQDSTDPLHTAEVLLPTTGVHPPLSTGALLLHSAEARPLRSAGVHPV